MAELVLSPGPVLVLAPHADDESLGCGLLLTSLWREGGAAHVVCITDGAASHPGSRTYPPGRLRTLRREELGRAIGFLGGSARDITFLDLPDAASHRVHGPGADIARNVDALVDRLGIATLIAPSPLDPHCDHEAASAAALRVGAAHPGLRLLFYPVWSRWLAPDREAPVPHAAKRLSWTRGSVRAKRAAIHGHRSQMGALIRDDPTGFTMPEGFAEHFAASPEVYFEGLRP